MSADGARVAEAMKQTNQVTIGHYIMGKFLFELIFVRQGSWQGYIRPSEARHTHFDRRKSKYRYQVDVFKLGSCESVGKRKNKRLERR